MKSCHSNSVFYCTNYLEIYHCRQYFYKQVLLYILYIKGQTYLIFVSKAEWNKKVGVTKDSWMKLHRKNKIINENKDNYENEYIHSICSYIHSFTTILLLHKLLTRIHFTMTQIKLIKRFVYALHWCAKYWKLNRLFWNYLLFFIA